jgi:hypothetical protein
MPLDKHEEVSIGLKGCGGTEGVVFELVDLPLDTKCEFRVGVISAVLPVNIDMELMSGSVYHAGLPKKLVESVKQAIGAGEPESEDHRLFADVEKISFVPREPTMYIRVTAEFAGELRHDVDQSAACKPLTATFVFEKLYWGFLPVTTAILLGTSLTVLLLFWLVGLPLLTWALGPQLIDETRKAQADAKKKN